MIIYYYHLLRFHISNQIHIRNRINLHKSAEDVLIKRRLLRAYVNK